ncbi:MULTISPECIES: hypothetical protein [Anaerostipes]|uniref:Uncharacterized protein n=2 Tax=Anaerostipes TaxID=207244 RepID=A0ABV4DMN8_9FIRM|nr:hypothetical protein [Anaerostipes hominis (ex Liu et al. 2021)]
MIKTVSRRIISDITIGLGKVAVAITRSDTIFGTLTDTVFPFTCRCNNRHTVTGNGKIGGINQSFGDGNG